MTNQILNLINSDPYLASQALSTEYKGKIFAVASYDQVEGFYKTKRGADGYIKRQGRVSYYDDYAQEMVTSGEGLQVVEIEVSDIVNPVNDMKIWYTHIEESYTNDWFVREVLKLAVQLNVNADILLYIQNAVNEALTEGTFTYKEDIEDITPIDEDEQVEKIAPEEPVTLTGCSINNKHDFSNVKKIFDITERLQKKKHNDLKNDFLKQFGNEILPSISFEEKSRLADLALVNEEAYNNLITNIFLTWKSKQILETI